MSLLPKKKITIASKRYYTSSKKLPFGSTSGARHQMLLYKHNMKLDGMPHVDVQISTSSHTYSQCTWHGKPNAAARALHIDAITVHQANCKGDLTKSHAWTEDTAVKNKEKIQIIHRGRYCRVKDEAFMSDPKSFWEGHVTRAVAVGAYVREDFNWRTTPQCLWAFDVLMGDPCQLPAVCSSPNFSEPLGSG